MFIPRGFAHGFIALEDGTVFQYKCDNFYNKASERALRYDSVDWLHNFTPNIDEFILSEKDKIHPTLETINQDYLFDYNINYYE